MSTLVGRNGDGVGVFLDRGTYDIQHTAVVAKVDNFTTLRLDQAAHDIDSRVVTIE
jgi:hypothetical protein